MGIYPQAFFKKMDASAAGYLNYLQTKNIASVSSDFVPIKQEEAK
jgi:hypothetical protein